MSGILSGLFVLTSIVGINYGIYRLGMWSSKKQLIETRSKLITQSAEDNELLIEEISNHLIEMNEFIKSKKLK